MEEFVEDDDFGDLYADVEAQVSSAINAIQSVSQLPMQGDEVYGNVEGNGEFQDVEEGFGGVNAEEVQKEVDGAEKEEDGIESEDGSETEDDFDIVLNDDDGDYDNCIGNGKDGFSSGGSGGRFVNDDEENEGNSRVANGGSSGGERSSGGKGGCHSSQYKDMRCKSTTFSSTVKSKGSAGVASYLSTFFRVDSKNDGCTYQFGKTLIGSQSGRNFSLPRSRTIVDVNIDALEQKPWRHPGADVADFFNFGFDEDSWRTYCNHLVSYRVQTTQVNSSAAYQHTSCSKDGRAEFDHEVVQEAATEPVVHCNQRREMSCTSQMLKGRAIQVKDGLGERQPSTNIRLPVDRDSDVVIEIPIQDLEEDNSNSNKVPFHETTNYLREASEIREAGVDDAEDMLYFSESEGELPMLEGSSEGTGKSNPHRHASTGDGNPSCLDSDSCESPCVSGSSDQLHQMTTCDSDGQAEEIKDSDEPVKSEGKSKTTKTSQKTPESSQSEQSQRSRGSSPSMCGYKQSRDGAYADPIKFHIHSKRASPNSVSELQESIAFDCHSSRNSRNPGVSMRSGNYKYARSRSPGRRNMKFHRWKSSRISRLENHPDDECASHMSDAEDLCDAKYPAVHSHEQRKRHHGFDSYGDKVCLYPEELEHSLNYRGARCPGKAGCAFVGYLHGKDSEDCIYKGYRYPGRDVKEKQNLPEIRTPRLSTEVMEQKSNLYRKGIYVQQIDSSNCDVFRQLISEQARYLDNGDYTRSKRRAVEFHDEIHFKRRIECDKFSAEHNYRNEFTQGKYQSMPYNGRERDYLEKSHDRELPYTRRKAKSPLNNTRYGNSVYDYEDIWQTACEDERSTFARKPLSFRSYRDHQTAGRGQERAASFSRNGMFGRHGWQWRQSCVEGYRGSKKLDGYNDGYITDDGDHDSFVVERRQYQHSEALHWLEDEIDRHQEETSYPFARTSNYKRFDSKHGSGCGRKLIDGEVPNKKRFKLPREGDRCSQLDRSSNSIHRGNLRRAPRSCWNSADSYVVVGDAKSSRCLKAGSLMYSGRYDLDWNNDLEQRTANGSNGSRIEEVIQADTAKIDGFQKDANRFEKLSDSLDIEEGQIVAEDPKKKPRQKVSASEVARKFISLKNSPSESAIHRDKNAEELQNPRIMEILAKMEKRRERFQQPITLKNAPEKHSKPVADSIPEAKAQRPVRKRKWGRS